MTTQAPPATADPAATPPPEADPQQPLDDDEGFSFFDVDDEPGTEPPAGEDEPGRGEEPTPEPTPSPIETLSDDELAGHERVQRLVEQRLASERQRLEQDAAIREATREREYARSEEILDGIGKFIRNAARELDDEGMPQVSRDDVLRELGPAVRFGADEVVEHIKAILQEDLGDGFARTDEETEQLRHAIAMQAQHPTDPRSLIRVGLAMRDRVWRERELAAARAEGAAEKDREWRERMRAARAEQRATNADATRRGTPAQTRTTNGRAQDQHDMTTRLGLTRAAEELGMSDDEFARRWAEL